MSNKYSHYSVGDPPNYWENLSIPVSSSHFAIASSAPTFTTVTCTDVEMDGVSMKKMVSQLSAMIPIFLPPEGDVMSTPAVKNAYDAYMDARNKLVAARSHLEFMIKLADNSKPK